MEVRRCVLINEGKCWRRLQFEKTTLNIYELTEIERAVKRELIRVVCIEDVVSVDAEDSFSGTKHDNICESYSESYIRAFIDYKKDEEKENNNEKHLKKKMNDKNYEMSAKGGEDISEVVDSIAPMINVNCFPMDKA